jgi:TolB-like protein/Flp pilus assembly protein TadD
LKAEYWKKIEAIVQSALDIESSAERYRFVANTCAGDEELKREVEQLIAAANDADSFIESPAWAVGGLLDSVTQKKIRDSLDEQIENADSFDETDDFTGKKIGVFELKKELGRGGMGAVYLAERVDGEFHQKAAVKLIKRGMDTDFIVKRFRHERQILAALNHPNIANLIDGGTTADGLPYFVMEYVDGKALYRFCDDRKLDTSGRLELFACLCDAVEAAHRLKVVHRDLKPSNILVKADGTPKLLDFGIAKILDSDLASATLEPTATAMRLMTPEYASPEQVCGEPVTPASDIYSLGVLLYELLTGHRPYRFRNRAMHEIHRAVCEEMPDVPSESLTREDNLVPTNRGEKTTDANEDIPSGNTTLETVFKARSTDFENLRRELAGDLDKVVLKTLRKNPAERYQTASELADDINRFLENRPVRAESFATIKKTFVSESKTKESDFAGKPSAAILPFKILGVTNQSSTESEEFLGIGLADALMTRLSVIKQIVVRPTSSVLALDADIDSFHAGQELAVNFVVDGNIRRVGERIRVTAQLLSISENATLWAETFDEKFTDVLEVEDSISERVAKSLLPQLTGEEQVQLNKRGTNNAAAYEAYLRGRFFWNQFTPDTFTKALEWFEKAVALDENYALAYVGMADFYNWATIFGMYAPSEGYQKTKAAAIRALEINDKLSEAHAVLGFLTTFADFDWTRGEYLLKHALELNPHNALGHEWYSALLAGVGRDVEAEREILRAHELDPLSLREKTLTAWHLYQLRRFPEALAVAEEIIEMNPLYYQGFFQRGNVLNEMGRSAEAVADLRKALAIAPDAGYLYYKLCFALAAVGKRDEARKILRDFEKLPRSAAASAYHLAMCYASLDEREAAFNWFNKAVENRDMWLVWLATEPKLDKFRDDERFNELLYKTNRPHLIRQIKKTSKKAQSATKVFAVLPFKFNSLVTGGDTDDKFLGVGLTDALISRLSKTRSLIVRPTSSVLQFDETSDAFAAGRELTADFVLDGNIRRIGERIRVSVQLLNVNQTSTDWAETFDEKFTDILEVEDSISERVVESLLPHLTGEEQRRISKRGTNSPAAYEAYLRGRFHWNQFTPESLSKAIESFQKAIGIDPNYALPYVGVADFYSWGNIYGLIPPSTAHDEAERAARRAIEIDSQSGEAYASLGLVLHNQMRWAEAVKIKLRSIELSPNYAYAHESWASHLIGTGRAEEGVKEMRLAESLDPLSLRTKTLSAWMLFQAHRFDDALATARQIFELDKNYPQGYSQTGFALWAMGRYEEALTNFQKFNEMIPSFALAQYQLCFGFAGVNRQAEARGVLNEMKTLAANGYVKPYFLAMAHVAVGEPDAAFDYFEQSFDEQEPWLLWFGTDPMLESLHDDARYLNLLERMNHPFVETFKTRNKAKNQPNSFAVLPFKLLQFNTGDDSEDQFLSIGLTDALITRLSKIRRIAVRPTVAVVRFANASDSFQAGRELEADFVLAGNIRLVGERVRISAQLLKVADNTTAWAETFDEKFTDVLELEDSIAERVAKSLLPKLTGEEQKQLQKRETDSPEAYEAYLKGRFYWSLMTEEGFSKAIVFYERAVALDPNYALAYAAIAEYYIFLGIHCVLPFAVCGVKSKAAAEKAAAIDPQLSEAQAALGIAALNHDFDWETSEKYFRRAIEISPNSILAHSWYQSLLLESGRFDEMTVELDRVLQLNPDSLLSLHYLAWAHFHMRRYDESIEVHRRILEGEPNYAWGHFTFSWLLRCAGNRLGAVAEARKGAELAPHNLMYFTALAAALAENGQRDEAVKMLDAINQSAATRYVSPYMLAIVYYSLSDDERAFELLETALAERDVWVVWLYVDPQFDRLRDDARFNDLLRQMKHPLAL